MIFSKSRIFLILCLSFILGVGLGGFLNKEIMVVAAMVFIVVLTLFWQNIFVKLAAFSFLVLLFGSFHFLNSLESSDLIKYFGETAEIQGRVAEEPDRRSDKTYLTLDSLKINNRLVSGRLLVSAQRFPEYEYGDRLQIIGKITEPKDAEKKGEFSYKNYLNRFGIEAVVYYPQTARLASNTGNPVKSGILRFKAMFIGNLSKILPEPQNSFLAGLLVGLRRGIPQELLDKFSATGVTHIIAISGFNITIIAVGIEKLLDWFGANRRISFILSLLAIILFVILTGGQPSVVRAGVMGGLLLLGLNVGRVYSITNALVFTAALMIFLNPKILRFDVGFQLSFLALMGLMYLSPHLDRMLRRLPKIVRLVLAPTLAAQIFVLPVLLVNFDRLSLIAPVTNFLILPIIPLTMLFGFLAGLVGLFSTWIAEPLAAISWSLLSYIIQAVEYSAAVPFSSFEVKAAGPWLTWVYYLILIGVLFFLSPRYRNKFGDVFKTWNHKQKV